MRHLLDITDLTTQEIDELIALAMDIIEQPEKYCDALKGKKLATLFYEPSTRTRLSFTAAMMEFGGNVLGFSDAAASSVSKGETVADTIRVVENFADIIAMRHNKDGAPWVAAQYSQVPIINAGDGGHCHPTQTLADLLTIFRQKGGFENLTVGFCGDLKYGRTVHSLTKALGRYKNVKFVFISPDELKIPDYLRSDIDKESYNYLETNSLENAMPELDILYMTRIQKERFDDENQYNRLKDSFILDAEKLKTAKKDMIILHPLPRVNEIATDVDNDPRACYFKQVLNGKFIRRALIYTLLRQKTQDTRHEKVVLGERCPNSRCISSIEAVKPLYKIADNGEKRCYYCDEIARR
ncbi:MAG: aspartate carbamoyltransferase [Prevotellaceae bacterium]|jgi:aspartate carbamoyltransferase catalytic subunit|nr:aspartate carbamoyltransferase [Prevotellaceae bacterium]